MTQAALLQSACKRELDEARRAGRRARRTYREFPGTGRARASATAAAVSLVSASKPVHAVDTCSGC